MKKVSFAIIAIIFATASAYAQKSNECKKPVVKETAVPPMASPIMNLGVWASDSRIEKEPVSTEDGEVVGYITIAPALNTEGGAYSFESTKGYRVFTMDPYIHRKYFGPRKATTDSTLEVLKTDGINEDNIDSLVMLRGDNTGLLYLRPISNLDIDIFTEIYTKDKITGINMQLEANNDKWLTDKKKWQKAQAVKQKEWLAAKKKKRAQASLDSIAEGLAQIDIWIAENNTKMQSEIAEGVASFRKRMVALQSENTQLVDRYKILSNYEFSVFMSKKPFKSQTGTVTPQSQNALRDTTIGGESYVMIGGKLYKKTERCVPTKETGKKIYTVRGYACEILGTGKEMAYYRIKDGKFFGFVTTETMNYGPVTASYPGNRQLTLSDGANSVYADFYKGLNSPQFH